MVSERFLDVGPSRYSYLYSLREAQSYEEDSLFPFQRITATIYSFCLVVAQTPHIAITDSGFV